MSLDLIGFGSQLQSLRLLRGLTQEELAQRLNCSAHYIGNLEQGVRKPSITFALALCNVLRATPNYLFKDSISPEMRSGIADIENNSTTLSDVQRNLGPMLSDMLPLDNGKTPTLFGIPVHAPTSASEPSSAFPWADIWLLKSLGLEFEENDPSAMPDSP